MNAFSFNAMVTRFRSLHFFAQRYKHENCCMLIYSAILSRSYTCVYMCHSHNSHYIYLSWKQTNACFTDGKRHLVTGRSKPDTSRHQFANRYNSSHIDTAKLSGMVCIFIYSTISSLAQNDLDEVPIF